MTLTDLTLLIEASKPSVRTPAVRVIRELDSLDMAWKLIVALEAGLGRTKPFTEGVRYKYWHSVLPMTNLACVIGRMIAPVQEQDTATRNKSRFLIGYHFLHLLAKEGVLDVVKGSKKTDKYRVRVCKNQETIIEELVGMVELLPEDVKIYTLPQFEKPEPFTRFWHPVAGSLVRNVNGDVIPEFTLENMPKVYEVINKHMDIAYNINRDLLDVYNLSQEDDIFTYANKDVDEEQLIGLNRERDAVLNLAEMVGDRTFWEYMFYDSRGRLYSSTVYLTHAGSKLSKSLFLYNEKKPIGSDGYFWMLVHAANCWGYDKDTIDGRHDYADGELDKWIACAKDPVNNKLWQYADSPFEFLAVIMEINKAMQNPGGVYAYESGLPVAWDATCSGLQVLSALARDEKSGALCNITETEERGDYYLMIADHVWKSCEFTEEEEAEYEKVNQELRAIDKEVKQAFKSENKNRIKAALEARKEYNQENREAIYSSSKVFWGKLYSKRRKICKRPCMTYFYSCGVKTMSGSMYRDFAAEAEFKGITSTYCFWLSKKIYEACRELMDAPTSLMDLFIQLGLDDYNEGKDFSITAPLTKFKMMQHYRNDTKTQVLVNYKGKRIKPKVIIGKGDKLNRSKVMSATSPNVVHMLDSQIVAGIVLKTNYTVSCIHDSFSTHASDAGKLFEDTREVFFDLFEEDILAKILEEKGKLHYLPQVKTGELALTEVFDNEYCFS